jgi:hypothetical protein
MSFAMYWIGFAWARFGLLRSLAAMVISALVAMAIVIWAWLWPEEDCC